MKPQIGSLVEVTTGLVKKVAFVTMTHPNGTFSVLFTDGSWVTFNSGMAVYA